MDQLTPVALRIPAPFEAEVRALSKEERDNLRDSTFKLFARGDSHDRMVAKLTDAGYSPGFADWYVYSVGQWQKPIEPFAGDLDRWGEVPLEIQRAIPEVKARVRTYGIAAVALHLTLFLLAGGFVATGVPLIALVPIWIAFRICQICLAYNLATLKDENPGCIAATTIPFGWIPILMMLLKRDRRAA